MKTFTDEIKEEAKSIAKGLIRAYKENPSFNLLYITYTAQLQSLLYNCPAIRQGEVVKEFFDIITNEWTTHNNSTPKSNGTEKKT